ncbi:MAG: 3-dehydroquinate synthase [Kangiellaceae bacterium]|nr:3-dehydroquinate synthase [Kangiellaceae bacterium]
MRSLQLPLKDNPYTIYIGSALISDGALISSHCSGNKQLIVSNNIVAPLYLEKLKTALGDRIVHQIIIEDGEINKNKTSYFKILDYLVEHEFRRNDTLIALGGGVIGDLAGFAAASYQRGMNLIQVPTSLLSQVDSSVGGKTAINHSAGKNLIGAFYQPSVVIIDTDSLDTLPQREYFSGLGEIVKYALLGESRIAELLQTEQKKIFVRDKEVLQEIIYLSCQMKANIVVKDEKEQGQRALLNLGHTFAHALETMTGYSYYLHGEAVAIGILMALNLSQRKGLIKADIEMRYRQLLEILNLPTSIKPDLDANEFLSVMKKDKKNQTSAYRLVLVEGDDASCHCILQEENDQRLIRSVLQHFGVAV